MTTYNCREQFEKSIQSALSQDYNDLEIVICDGGSTDGTVEAIKSMAQTVADHAGGSYRGKRLIWESQKDRGIYDGFNKGIHMSTGDILAVFNDLFTCANAVTKFVAAIENNDVDGAHSDLVYMVGGKCIRYWKMGRGNLHTGWMPAHPTLYLKREVYEKYGDYDLRYHTSADYDFILRILKDDQVHLAYIPEVLISMYYGGTSNNGLKGYILNVREAYAALQRNHISFPALAIIFRHNH